MPKQPQVSRRNIVFRPLAEVQPALRNPKAHDLGAIIASIKRFGFADAVVLDERTGRLVSGHGRCDALAEMQKRGDAAPDGVLVVDGVWHVPVQMGWASKDDTEAEAFLVAANRLVEVGGWDDSALHAILADLSGSDALEGIGYSQDDVRRIIAEAQRAALVPQTDEDFIPESVEPRTKLGDVWVLGAHRLMCGDSTNAAHVGDLLGGAKPHLMVTDPPYGVGYDANWRNEAERAVGKPIRGRAIGKVLNDDRADWREAWQLFPGEVAYVWHADTKTHIVAQSLIACDFELRNLLIWAKSAMVIGRGHYHSKHEPLWYAVRKGGKGHWQGDRTQTTVWDIDKPRKSATGHSTQKPVECMRRPITNNSAAGDAVYDPFCGSGTTIIAAEETARRCFAMELNPAYVDIAVSRWEAYTGKQAAKL